MRIIPATPDDLVACQVIYAHHVLYGTGTFEEVPPSLEMLTMRYETILAAGYSWLVAQDDSGCLGFAYYGPFRARPAYRYTVEDSIYVRDQAQGRGVGRALLAAVMASAASAGYKQMLALIGDSENFSSIGLHASQGFREVGRIYDVGFKFNRWLDVVTMQRAL
jgi:phosphinothricin acetyltransferase